MSVKMSERHPLPGTPEADAAGCLCIVVAVGDRPELLAWCAGCPVHFGHQWGDDRKAAHTDVNQSTQTVSR